MHRIRKKKPAVGVLRVVGRPFRSYFNNHFEMVKDEVRRTAAAPPADDGEHLPAELRRFSDQFSNQLSDALTSISSTSSEGNLFLARQLSEVRHHGQIATEGSARVLEQLARLSTLLDELLGSVAPLRDSGIRAEQLLAEVKVALVPPVPSGVNDVQPRDAALLNRLNSHDGYRSQAGVWVNEALSTGFVDGDLTLNDINERIAEVPFVFTKLAGLERGSRILDVGCCESTVSLSLASLGFDVTALDPRPYPFAHPRLTVATVPVERFQDSSGFDAVILLSTIEHLGVGAYGLDEDTRLDLQAMAHLRSLMRPGGRVVLTTPFGVRSMNELERTYDTAGVHQLLDGYSICGEPEVLVRRSRTEWIPDRGGFTDVDDERQRVIMLEARLIEK